MQGRDDDKQMRWPTADGSAADRNSVPRGRMIYHASVANLGMAPGQRAKQVVTSSRAGATRTKLWSVETDNIEKVLAVTLFHVFSMRTDAISELIKIDNITKRHPSADLHISLFPLSAQTHVRNFCVKRECSQADICCQLRGEVRGDEASLWQPLRKLGRECTKIPHLFLSDASSVTAVVTTYQ